MSLPSIRICPPVGRSKPAISRRVLVLPHPDGPSNEKNSPGLDLEIDMIDGGGLAECLVEAN